jgi:hypothetical protein
MKGKVWALALLMLAGAAYAQDVPEAKKKETRQERRERKEKEKKAAEKNARRAEKIKASGGR